MASQRFIEQFRDRATQARDAPSDQEESDVLELGVLALIACDEIETLKEVIFLMTKGREA